jgi:hypothetical protein
VVALFSDPVAREEREQGEEGAEKPARWRKPQWRTSGLRFQAYTAGGSGLEPKPRVRPGTADPRPPRRVRALSSVTVLAIEPALKMEPSPVLRHGVHPSASRHRLELSEPGSTHDLVLGSTSLGSVIGLCVASRRHDPARSSK